MSKVTCCRCRWNPFRRCGENTICSSCCNILSKCAQKCVEKKVNLCYKCLLQKLLSPQYCCGDAPSLPTNALSSISTCKTQQIKKKREACVFFPYFCFGFIGAKIKMFAYFLQTCIHSFIKLYGICRDISHNNCIFQFSEEWMQENPEMTRFNLPLSWTRQSGLWVTCEVFGFRKISMWTNLKKKTRGRFRLQVKEIDFVKV